MSNTIYCAWISLFFNVAGSTQLVVLVKVYFSDDPVVVLWVYVVVIEEDISISESPIIVSMNVLGGIPGPATVMPTSKLIVPIGTDKTELPFGPTRPEITVTLLLSTIFWGAQTTLL